MSNKKSEIQRPARDPDHVSKRDVPYWWSPEWVRGTSADFICDQLDPRLRDGFEMNSLGKCVKPCPKYGKIAAVKEKNGEVNLYMKSKSGSHSFIQGSIQKEFKQWHTDRSIDYILLGMDIDELIVDEN